LLIAQVDEFGSGQQVSRLRGIAHPVNFASLEMTDIRLNE